VPAEERGRLPGRRFLRQTSRSTRTNPFWTHVAQPTPRFPQSHPLLPPSPPPVPGRVRRGSAHRFCVEGEAVREEVDAADVAAETTSRLWIPLLRSKKCLGVMPGTCLEGIPGGQLRPEGRRFAITPGAEAGDRFSDCMTSDASTRAACSACRLIYPTATFGGEGSNRRLRGTGKSSRAPVGCQARPP
jgi:hypothetical protein